MNTNNLSEEARIYVILPVTVQPNGKNITQPVGRLMAQVGHVVSKLRLQLPKGRNKKFTPITTIVLAARDNKELEHIGYLLLKEGLRFTTFKDTNPPAYGPGEITTALATEPLYAGQTVGILDYLPLFS